MGVTYSLASEQKGFSESQLKVLRLSYEDADKLINAYFTHQFQPVMESESLQILFYAAYGRRLESELAATMSSCQEIFKGVSSMWVGLGYTIIVYWYAHWLLIEFIFDTFYTVEWRQYWQSLTCCVDTPASSPFHPLVSPFLTLPSTPFLPSISMCLMLILFFEVYL